MSICQVKQITKSRKLKQGDIEPNVTSENEYEWNKLPH